jgi:hypothetical protein
MVKSMAKHVRAQHPEVANDMKRTHNDDLRIGSREMKLK